MPHPLGGERTMKAPSLGDLGTWTEYLENGIPHKCKLFMSGITGKLTSQVLEKWNIRSVVRELRWEGPNPLIY